MTTPAFDCFDKKTTVSLALYFGGLENRQVIIVNK
jgi:hypothetical protein